MAEKEVHLRDYLAVIRKHDFLVAVSFLLVFGSALIVSLYMPRVYEASATIEIQSSTPPSGLSNLMSSVMLGSADQVSMQTVCERFTSRSLLSETIRNLKKQMPDMRGYPESPDALASRVRARIVPDTSMIEVTVRMRRDEGGSQTAAMIANELVSAMQSYRSAKTGSEMERRQDFVDGKIEEVQHEIDKSDQDIQEFLKGSGDAAVWSARADYVLTRLSTLVDLKERSEIALAAEIRKRQDLESRLEKEPEWMEQSRTFSRDVLWDKNRTDLANLQRRLVATRAELGENHPEVKVLEAQIAEIMENMKASEDLANLQRELVAAQAELGENDPKIKALQAQIEKIMEEMKAIAQEMMSAKTESRNPIYQALLDQKIDTELRMINYETQIKIVEEMLAALNDEKEKVFSEMSESLFQLDKMRREIDYKVDIHKSLLEKKLEAEIWAVENSGDDAGRTKGGIEVVDMAQPSSHTVSPRVKFIGAIAGLVGLVVGLGMAFMAEYFEKTYRSPEEAREALGIPVLGIIPSIRDQQPGKFSVMESPMSAEAESFRTLVTNIEFSSAESPHKALLITSSGADEGKSFVAANLAVAMAQTKERVVIVDCDMRKAMQHSIFGVDNEKGLANLLVGNADLGSVIRDTDVPNLKVISCGPTPPNPVELLKSSRMGEVMSELRSAWDVILCDSPPVLPVADALVLASKLDGVLLVADLNHTARNEMSEALERLSKLDAPMLGLVCNKVSTAKYNSYYHGRAAS
jgi:succinoglycan biosynthesis transport protein ExoP